LASEELSAVASILLVAELIIEWFIWDWLRAWEEEGECRCLRRSMSGKEYFESEIFDTFFMST
jgi:hypothetical protein